MPKAEPKYAKYVWLVKGQKILSGSINPCDIRRYAFSHEQAVSQVARGNGFDKWNLYKLVKVNKYRSKRKA